MDITISCDLMCVSVVGYDGTGSEWEYLNADGVDLTSVSISFLALKFSQVLGCFICLIYLLTLFTVSYVSYIYVIY
jgi:hypothetical protein